MTIDYSILDKWYEQYIPKRFDDLIQFTVKSNELTKEIIDTPIAIDNGQHMPYLKNGICYLPSLFYIQDFYKEYLEIEDIRDMIYSAVALVNGAQIHEALHKKILGEQDDYFKILKFCDKNGDINYLTDMHKMCFNLIEDIFSEYICSIEYPFIYPFIELMNQVLFNEQIRNKVVSNLSELNNVQNVFNALLFQKNNVKLENLDEYYTILDKSYNVDLTLDERLNISHELYELFEKHNSENGNKCSELFDEDMPDNVNWELIDYSEISELIEGFYDSLVLDELSNIESKFISFMNEQNIKSPEIIFENVKIKGNIKELKFNSLFNGFSQYLRNSMSLRQNYIEPRLTGSKILTNRLSQALIDGKIFARRDIEQMNKSEPELIFLIDLSGSMRWGNLINPVLSVGMTLFKDLLENNISCAFYGHTTNKEHYFDDSKIVITGIASNNMPLMKLNNIETTRDYETCFNNCLNILNSENGDGFAIDFVSKRFSNRQGKKVLIVLSDGLPSIADSGYIEKTAINHTKSVIENLRKSNISVVSLSLVSSVMRDNNEIYGTKNNIAAYEGYFESNVKKLIENIVI